MHRLANVSSRRQKDIYRSGGRVLETGGLQVPLVRGRELRPRNVMLPKPERPGTIDAGQ